MATDSVNAELRRREIIRLAIDGIILSSVKRSSRRSRVRRGIILDLVCSTLGVNKSSRIKTTVNERMVGLGFAMVTINGKKFYCGLKMRDGT